MESVLQSDHERLIAEVGHEIGDAKPTTIEEAIKILGRKYHENTETSANVKHMPVMPQNGGANCGFHMFFNSKCMLRAITA